MRGRNVRYHVNFSFNFHLTAVLFSSYTCSILFLTPVLFSFFTCKTRFKMLKSFPFFLTFFIPLFLITLPTLFYRLLREFLRRVNDEFEVGQGRSCIRNNSHYSKAISHTSCRGGSSTVDMYRTANTHRTRYPHRWTGSRPYANCHRSGGEPTATRLTGDSTYPVRQRQLPHVHYADLGRQTPASSEQSGHATPRNVWKRCRPAHLCTQC